jgi:translation initiation factor 2 beta subunit (eIF-2beta)/eIF-5
MRSPRIALAALTLALVGGLAHAAFEFRIPVQGLRAPVSVDPEQPPAGFSLSQLVAVPSPVVLPATEVGAPVSVLATLENRNDESVTVQSIVPNVAQVSVTGACLGATLAKNELCSFSTELAATGSLNTEGAVLTVATDRGAKTVPLGPLIVTAAQTPQATLDPATALAFDLVDVGSTRDKSVTLTNTGTRSLVLSTQPTLTPPSASFSVLATDCEGTLAPQASCTTTVRFAPSAYGGHSTALRFEGNMPGGFQSLAVMGTGVAARAELTANASADFGNFQVGGSATRSFTLRNTGNKAANGVFLSLPTNAGLTASSNSCGSAGAPVSLAAGADCSVTLTWQPTGNASLAGATIVSNGTFEPQAQLSLSGTAGTFNATAAWSSSYSSVVEPSPGYLNFGARTPGSTKDIDLYLRNTGTHGAMRVRFVLSGDTSQFAIVNVQKQYYGAYNNKTACGWTSAGAPCQTDDRVANNYSHVYAQVRYAPVTVGPHSLTITPVSENGTALPGAITLTGTGTFNPAAAWSTDSRDVVQPTAGALNFGPRTPGSTKTLDLYLRNTGTNGAMRVNFVLSGDVSQFALANVQKQYHSAYNEKAGCGWTSAGAPCLTDDKAVNSYSHIFLQVRYAPLTVGSHTLTITPVSDNGTALPGAITFTGEGLFNAQGAWSTNNNALVVPSASYLDFGSRTPDGPTKDIDLYLRNIGTNGAMRVNFVLSGDVTQFALVSVRKQYYSNGSNIGNCAWSPTSFCQADDKALNSYSHIFLRVRYAPTSLGAHTLTITPVSDNGTVLPGAITLTGQGAFNPSASWSSSDRDVVEPSISYRNFGTRAVGSTNHISLYLRNTGTNGAMRVNFVLSGDVSQFALANVQKQYYSNGSNTRSCSWSASVFCQTDEPTDTSNGYQHVWVSARFAPTLPGSYTLTITPVSDNGTVLPGAITLVGTAN